ncbi:MAG TPA: HD-GYP domain-containing protein, partial [Anaerolineales bacterium]|nr:HD-GYP domain-containing protein [Anaerolineales bacterium]
QAAQALVNARLYEEAQRRLQNIQALHRMDLAISGSLDVQISLKIILEELTRHLHVDAANVLVLNPYMNMLEFTVGHGFKSLTYNKSVFRLGEGLPGKIALSRTPLHIPDQVEKHLESQRFNLLAPEKFRAYYGLPLVAKAQVQGVIEIFHRNPLEPDVEWLEFVETIAGQAAIAIENINLFNKLQRSNTELALAYDITLEGWSRAMDMRDRETEGHTQRVAEMTVKLGQAMGLTEAEIINARRGALLHDMGKLGIPDEILLKPGQLSEEEWEIMKKHPSYAYEMLSPISYLRPALDIPYCHHEKWDGTGYPRGLRGESIPIAARIFSVADVWDALRSDRPYRKAWSSEKVIAYIQEHSGTYFDPRVVEAFMSVIQHPNETETKSSIRKMFIEE